MRIIISDEGEVEWKGVERVDECMERGRMWGDMCEEGEVLVFMCKEVLVEVRLMVSGKVDW